MGAGMSFGMVMGTRLGLGTARVFLDCDGCKIHCTSSTGTTSEAGFRTILAVEKPTSLSFTGGCIRVSCEYLRKTCIFA